MSGIRGCEGMSKRHGVLRRCAQQWIVERGGKRYCWYHDPDRPHKFGEGYRDDEMRRGSVE